VSGHIVVTAFASGRDILAAAQEAMKAGFGLTHVTIQIEDEAWRQSEGRQRS